MNDQLTGSETMAAADAVIRQRRRAELRTSGDSLTDELMSLVQGDIHQEANSMRRTEVSRLLGEIEDQLAAIRREL